MKEKEWLQVVNSPGTVLDRSHWWLGQGGAGRLTNAATMQAQKQGYEVALPNIDPIWDLLGHMD